MEIILLPVPLAATAFGLYSLLKTAVLALIRERKIGTELFISIAVIVFVLGKKYVACSVVLMIILIAEYITSASGEKARASLKALIGSIPQTAILKNVGKEQSVSITTLTAGDIVVVKTENRTEQRP